VTGVERAAAVAVDVVLDPAGCDVFVLDPHAPSTRMATTEATTSRTGMNPPRPTTSDEQYDRRRRCEPIRSVGGAGVSR
jgi:hypothetical protein